MNRILLTLLVLSICQSITAQKKILDHPDFALWNRISDVQISNDGAWISYEVRPGEGDGTLHLFNVSTGASQSFARAGDAQLTWDSRYLIYRITPAEDSVNALRRQKVKKEQLPKDSLVIYELSEAKSTVIPDVISYQVPAKWSGSIVFQVAPQSATEDSTSSEKKSKAKKYSKKNGYPLIAMILGSGTSDTLDYVTEYLLAEEGPGIAAISQGRDSTLASGVYVLNPGQDGWRAVKRQGGDYQDMRFSRDGAMLAFHGDIDTSEVRIRPVEIYLWTPGDDSARVAVSSENIMLPDGWRISEYGSLRFSEQGDRLFFGVAPEPILEDTTLLDNEIVNVEVWHYQDERLFTQQSVRADSEKKRTYLAMLDIPSGKAQKIATTEFPDARLDPDRQSPYVILTRQAPYLREMSWTGMTLRDVLCYHINSGERKPIAKGIGTTPSISPADQFLTWYSRMDSTWVISDVQGNRMTDSKSIPRNLYNEEHDTPSYPGAYGSAGWTRDDERFLVYDQFDIWSINPAGKAPALQLTNGRTSQTRYLYINTDPDQRYIDPDQPMLLSVFNEQTKSSGYAFLDLKTGQLTQLIYDYARYSSRPYKARDADIYIFTRETFEEFPDLRITTDNFRSALVISDANPQQSDYQWGTAELFKWDAPTGRTHEGLLIKPADFDPDKQYPMIVNFYEKSSDGLYNHRAPAPHRSTINYSFYASRGYVIFNPDVYYTTGQPGQDAYDAVVSGTRAVLDLGFVDPDRIGVQGHSWGGYQIADLITRTDLFACAEAGAPVVNMVSAYGGIRWQTGLSRMFQYEHTQSRLGVSLWEDPQRYLENSPVFNLDKVTTPVLIMHNDSDGHVPWYQGIEFFVAMRRLGKPAWMLNYNDEPHWPLKLQNRKDFNIRLQQFFDHYLKDAPMPKWMRDGVPAVEKGIRQGYELIQDD